MMIIIIGSSNIKQSDALNTSYAIRRQIYTVNQNECASCKYLACVPSVTYRSTQIIQSYIYRILIQLPRITL